MPDPPPYPGISSWVKACGAVATGLILLVVVVAFTRIGGSHGTGRHHFEYQQGKEP